jgi:hypothetical protein
MRLRTLQVAALWLLLLAPTTLPASVGVYPQALFINAPNKSVAITVSNPTELRQEIWVDFRYGYPLVNDSGNFYIHYADSASPGEPSAVRWLTVYPQRFTLNGRESQVVRVLASLPVGLNSGEYWARVIVSSKPRTGSATPVPGGSVTTKMDFISEINLPLQVRTGAVSSGLKIHNVVSAVGDGALKMGVDLSRTGNASFWGTMRLTVRDSDGRVMAKQDQPVAIYRDMVYPLTLDVAALTSGSYVVEINVDNVRQGVPAQHRVKADPVRYTYQFGIP